MPSDLWIDHVQIAAPPGCEAAARRFYGELLELRELPKPHVLSGRGGCWFACGTHQLHIGVESDFRPARKAHPALGTPDLDRVRQQLTDAGIAVSQEESLEGRRRFYVHDPWGNRLEFIEARGAE